MSANQVSIPETRYDELSDYHDQVVNDPAWDEIAGSFGKELPPDGIVREAALEALVKPFDSRNGAERQGAPLNEYVEQALSSDATRGERFYAGLEMFRLIGTKEVDTDTLRVVHGGIVTSMLMRSLHSQHGSGQAKGSVAYTGSERELNSQEVKDMERFLPGVAYEPTEAGATHAILMHMYPERTVVQADKQFKAYETPSGMVYWANAPIARELPQLPDDNPDRPRANTADSFHFLAKELGIAGLGHEVTVVTNDIYVLFQNIDAKHIFRGIHGVPVVSVAGFTPAHGVGMMREHFNAVVTPKERTAGDYAQELRSAQRSDARLHMTLNNSSRQQ